MLLIIFSPKSRLVMTHRSTTGILTQKYQCSGSTSTLRHQKCVVVNYRKEIPWPQFSGIAIVFCRWINFHRRLPCVKHTTQKCWEICIKHHRKTKRNADKRYTDPVWQCIGAHVTCCIGHSTGHSISTALTCTLPWHPVTSTYFVIWRSTFMTQDFVTKFISCRPTSHISTARLWYSI